MEKYDDISIFKILLKDDEFGTWVYDDQGEIKGGKPFVVYSENVRAFIDAVNARVQSEETVIEKSKEGAESGQADKELLLALLKAIVKTEECEPGTVLERLKDGTVQSLLERL